VAKRLLPWILEQEAGNFRVVERLWRPTNLLVEPYRRNMLKDIESRYVRLEGALDEITELPRADVYIRLFTRMRLLVRQAKVAWRFDDLSFLQAVGGFYTNYGALLRHLQDDKARGRLDNPPMAPGTTEPKDKGRLRP
jgi:hypothetical protein